MEFAFDAGHVWQNFKASRADETYEVVDLFRDGATFLKFEDNTFVFMEREYVASVYETMLWGF